MPHKWIRLRNFRCPAVGCGSSSGGNWICGTCETPMYIAQTGYLSCRYDTHIGKINEFSWNCGNHGNHPIGKYRRTDAQGFSFALSQAVQLMEEGGAEWVAALILEIGKQF